MNWDRFGMKTHAGSALSGDFIQYGSDTAAGRVANDMKIAAVIYRIQKLFDGSP